ncbi:hypothetical protein PSPO01_06127 [Paraphaeosphaeria sporulosa]
MFQHLCIRWYLKAPHGGLTAPSKRVRFVVHFHKHTAQVARTALADAPVATARQRRNGLAGDVEALPWFAGDLACEDGPSRVPPQFRAPDSAAAMDLGKSAGAMTSMPGA